MAAATDAAKYLGTSALMPSSLICARDLQRWCLRVIEGTMLIVGLACLQEALEVPEAHGSISELWSDIWCDMSKLQLEFCPIQIVHTVLSTMTKVNHWVICEYR